MCIYIILYTYINVHMYAIYIYTQTSTYVRTYIHTYIHAHIHKNTYLHTFKYIRTHVHTYIHTHTHIYIYVHAYIHTHTHTHTHTYMHACMHTYIHRPVILSSFNSMLHHLKVKHPVVLNIQNKPISIRRKQHIFCTQNQQLHVSVFN